VHDFRRFLHPVHTTTDITVVGERIFNIPGGCRAFDDGDAAAVGNRAGGLRIFPPGDSSQIDAKGCAVPAYAGPVWVLSGQRILAADCVAIASGFATTGNIYSSDDLLRQHGANGPG